MTAHTNTTRSFITVSGPDRVSFLQGILTQDITKLQDDKIQFAALLSPQGKILHDMFLVELADSILIDTQAQYAETLLKRLAMYKLRAKVTIEKVGLSDDRMIGLSVPLPDPRHPELPLRDYSAVIPAKAGIHLQEEQMDSSFRWNDGGASSALGIPELGRDFEPDQIVPLDAGYDLLNAISFTKGCYVGQEVTARMHYKNIARRGFFILSDEAGIPQRLALLKFEDMFAANDHVSPVTGHRSPLITVDNVAYHAKLPGWMQPKLAQFHTGAKNQ